jgi:hypothetical protein
LFNCGTCGSGEVFKNLANFCGFSFSIRKIFGIWEPFKKILKRPTQGTFLSKISFVVIIVSEKMFFKEMLTRNVKPVKHTSCHDIRSEWILFWPKNIGHRKLSSKIEKEAFTDYKTDFCSPLAIMLQCCVSPKFDLEMKVKVKNHYWFL